MHRRAFLRTGVAATAATALPGCAGLLETRAVGVPPIPEDRPDGIYVPTHGGSLYALTDEPVHDRQSGDNTATPTPSKDRDGLSVFERFQDNPVLPLTFGGATLGGAGLVAYRWLNDTDSTEDKDFDE